MFNVLIIADSPGWCFARRANALRRNAPENFHISVINYSRLSLKSVPFSRYHLVFLLAPNKAPEIRDIFSRLSIHVPLVVSHNSGPGRNGYRLAEDCAAADYVIANNYAAWAHGAHGARDFRCCNISNGVDTNKFFPTVPITERPKKVLWCASTGKAHGADDVKGYQQILKPLEIVLPTHGIETDFRVIEPGPCLDERGMNDWYNTGSVLVCASSSEGTPNIAIEAAAAGCVVVSSPVGNMPELIDNDHNGILVDDRQTIPFVDSIIHAMEHRRRLSGEMKKIIPLWDWSKRSAWFYSLFRGLIETGPESIPPFSYLDTAPEDVAP